MIVSAIFLWTRLWWVNEGCCKLVYVEFFFYIALKVLRYHIPAYRQASDIRYTLVGNKIAGHSDVVGASPIGAAPTTSSFSTWFQ